MAPLDGHHAWVTGGGTGVGAAVALALAEAGARVTISGRRQAPLAETAGGNATILPLVADVTDPASLTGLVKTATDQNGAIDIVVANAGAAASTPFGEQTPDDFNAMVNVNLTGVFNTFQAVYGAMTAAGTGRMIAIASTAGLKGYAYVTGYCAAKHGVIGLVRALAAETARTGITVNAVCPGYTETPLLDGALDTIVAKTGMSRADAARALQKNNPQGRFIQPSEVAAAVLWLCSKEAGSVTGQAVSISGGEI